CMRKDVSKASKPGGIAGLFWQSDPKDRLKPFLYEFHPTLAEYKDKIEVYETYICNGDPIYVLGKAEIYDPNEKTPRLIIKDDKRTGIFCISDGTEKNALSGVGNWLFLKVFGSPILAFIGVEIAILGLFEFNVPIQTIGQLMFAGLIVPLLLYAWLSWALLTAVYNGLILLKHQIERSKANVDTFLLKRHDLVPNLVKVVEGYSGHERGLMDAVAQIRGAKVGESEKILFAISENYPNLKANANFLSLQKELVYLENQIAGSREYFNDSVMLYDRQIASFPHLIVAKAIKLKPIEYYTISEEAAKAPVEIGGD
ncbi:MAG: LemA family protein, partial [Candidatus Micrarchaeota archaeon]